MFSCKFTAYFQNTFSEEHIWTAASASFHHRNIQSDAIEMLQIKHGHFCQILTDAFTQTTQEYNFRQNRGFTIPPVSRMYHGSKSTFFFRSKRPEVFCKKGILRNFIKFTGKHLHQSLFLINCWPKAHNFIKKESLAQVFSCEFSEIFKNTFLYRTPPMAASIKTNKTIMIKSYSERA